MESKLELLVKKLLQTNKEIRTVYNLYKKSTNPEEKQKHRNKLLRLVKIKNELNRQIN
jgi:hypothetical protein